MTPPLSTYRPGHTRWPGYAAAAVAFAFAGVSFDWGLGGTAGVSSLGGSIAARALAHDPLTVTLAWVTGVLKVLGGLLALALVQWSGRRLPRCVLLLIAWGGAVVLTVYGALQITGVRPYQVRRHHTHRARGPPRRSAPHGLNVRVGLSGQTLLNSPQFCPTVEPLRVVRDHLSKLVNRLEHRTDAYRSD